MEKKDDKPKTSTLAVRSDVHHQVKLAAAISRVPINEWTESVLLAASAKVTGKK